MSAAQAALHGLLTLALLAISSGAGLAIAASVRLIFNDHDEETRP